MLIERGAQRGANLLIAEWASTETDECESLWQQVTNPEVEERGNNLAVRKVTRCAEEDNDIRIRNALDAQSGPKRILRPLLRCRLSCLATEPQFTNCGVAFARLL